MEYKNILSNLAHIKEENIVKLQDLDKQIEHDKESIMKAKAEGDLRENFEYASSSEALARHTQMKYQLQESINKFENIPTKFIISEFISIGSAITIKHIESGEVFKYMLVPEGVGNAAKGLLSVSTPVGSKLLGRKNGEEVIVKYNVKDLSYKIIDVYMGG